MGLILISIVALHSGGILKLLLTSGGVTNASIQGALVDLLGKPTADATALCIPTAQWGTPCAGRSRREDSSAAFLRGVA